MRVPHRVRKRIKKAKRARVARQKAAHGRAHSAPPVLCNSIQKAGTHLLVGIVDALPGYQQFGHKAYWHYFNRAAAGRETVATPATVRASLEAGVPGEVLRGHVAHHPEIAADLARLGYRHLLIVRDPRDVVVSLLHWWNGRRDIDTWPYRYFASLPEEGSARLRFLIDGWPSDPPDGFPTDVEYPDLGQRMAEYLGWFEDPDCLVVRYEDLTGPDWEDAYKAVAHHVAPELDAAAALEDMRVGADPSKSKTFRTGGSGRWRQSMSDEDAAHLEAVVAPVMGPLGYA